MVCLLRTSRCRRFVLCSTLCHLGDGTSCGGYNLLGLLRYTLANGALVYPNQGGDYSVHGCVEVR